MSSWSKLRGLTYMWVSNFGRFLISKKGVDLYVDRLIREYIRYFTVFEETVFLGF